MSKTDEVTKVVLVVDDEEDIRNYLSMALEDAGFTVLTASDGFEALEIARKERPDLISLDLVMPKRSGAKFYQDLQRDPQLAKIPVILVTGHARDDQGKPDFDELTMSGIGVYLEKPVKPVKYVEAVSNMLGVELAHPDKAKEDVRSELEKRLGDASLEDLQKALDAMKKKEN